jgi:peptidoglycan/LPS O-acetylase OafA/YrhL
MGSASLAETKQNAFRPEIEGLRALASILVAVFHIWLRRVSGGVDVFFVVSGFLITTGLLGQIERGGGVRFALFWGRLVKRLAPAAFTVLGAVVVVSVLLLPKARWKDTLEQILASAGYVENWVLAHNSVDYLAAHVATSPVQHYWALSVQGQFYFTWPILMAGVALLARRSGLKLRTAACVAFAAVFVCSMAFSIYITTKNQPFAYFNTLARAWEFSIGGTLAATMPFIRLPRAARVAAGWIGVAAIISCGLLLQVSRVFPGYAALWPTLGGMLVVMAGTSGSPFGADRILGSKPLVFIGGLSYALYLWHFPAMIFYELYSGHHEIGLGAGCGILAVAFTLAYLTSRFIENPARFSKPASEAPKRAFAIGGVYAAALAVLVGAWFLDYKHIRRVTGHPITAGSPNYPGAAALLSGFVYSGAPGVPVYPNSMFADSDRPSVYQNGCNQAEDVPEARSCILGDPNGRITVAVVGGSHSAHWLPTLEAIARQDSWKVVAYVKSNCPFTAELFVVHRKINSSCRDWNESVVRELLALKPQLVFTTATRYNADDLEVIPDGYKQQWKRLADAGIQIAAIRDNPRFGFNVAECVELHGVSSPLCSRPRGEVLVEPSPLVNATGISANVHFIDLSDAFCERATCPPVAGNILIYRDLDHLTSSYAITLAPILRPHLRVVIDATETTTAQTNTD